jgi:hypothetical protein
MLTVTLNELEVNAVAAALDLRLAELTRQQGALKAQRSTEDRDFALACVTDAIRDTMRARITLATSLPEPEFPASMRYADLDWSEVEIRAAWGDR